MAFKPFALGQGRLIQSAHIDQLSLQGQGIIAPAWPGEPRFQTGHGAAHEHRAAGGGAQQIMHAIHPVFAKTDKAADVFSLGMRIFPRQQPQDRRQRRIQLSKAQVKASEKQHFTGVQKAAIGARLKRRHLLAQVSHPLKGDARRAVLAKTLFQYSLPQSVSARTITRGD